MISLAQLPDELLSLELERIDAVITAIALSKRLGTLQAKLVVVEIIVAFLEVRVRHCRN